jgi:hypothetical protein
MTMVDYQKCLECGDLRSTSLAGETPARTSKDRDQRERANAIHAENHARDNKIASKKGLKIAEKTPQAYF